MCTTKIIFNLFKIQNTYYKLGWSLPIYLPVNNTAAELQAYQGNWMNQVNYVLTKSNAGEKLSHIIKYEDEIIGMTTIELLLMVTSYANILRIDVFNIWFLFYYPDQTVQSNFISMSENVQKQRKF